MKQKLPATGRRLAFTGKRQVELQEFVLRPSREGEVFLRIDYTLMSIGTENIVFNRSFASGTHWDNWVKYPFFPGYSAVGTVLASQSAQLQVGERVVVRCGHQSHFVCAESECVRIPNDLSFDKAVWFALAKITFHGALAADYWLGDTVLIVGAGPIGQMSARWAHAAGVAEILVIDPAVDRLSMAKKGGATAVIAGLIGEAREAVLEANSGCLPRVVVDSTGHSAVLSAALGLVREMGRIVLLGDAGNPADQHLTSDVITRGLTVVGAHDCQESPSWTSTSIIRMFLNFAASGRFPLDGLNTHVFRPLDCVTAYQTANYERSQTMGIVFDWSS